MSREGVDEITTSGVNAADGNDDNVRFTGTQEMCVSVGPSDCSNEGTDHGSKNPQPPSTDTLSLPEPNVASFVSARYVMNEIVQSQEPRKHCTNTPCDHGDARLSGGHSVGECEDDKDDEAGNVMQNDSATGQGGVEAHPVKRRKIRMDLVDCMEHMSTRKGAVALTNPALTRKTSQDPNRGLYPRLPRADPALSGTFVNAREVLLSSGFHVASQHGVGRGRGSRGRGKHARASSLSQNNTLETYFSGTPSSRSQPSPAPAVVPGPSSSISSGNCKLQTNSQTPPFILPKTPKSPRPKTTLMFSGIKKTSSGANTLYVMNDVAGEQQPSQQSDNWSQEDIASAAKRDLMSSLGHQSKDSSQWRCRDARSRPSQSRTRRKEPPKFNRGNSFLYNSDLAKPLPSEFRVKSDKYGLLGTCPEIDSDEEEDQFLKLPLEVVENILCRLPIMDLLLNVNRVCLDWNDVISNERVSRNRVLMCSKKVFSLAMVNYKDQ